MFEFSTKWDGQLRRAAAAKHRINLTEPRKKIIYQNPYRANRRYRRLERTETNIMLTEDFFEPANTEWFLPIAFTLPKGTYIRFCVVYRKLNAVAVRDSYLMSKMDYRIDTFGDAETFWALDANASRRQIEMDKYAKNKTASVRHHGLYS